MAVSNKKPASAENTKTPRERFTTTGVNRVNSVLDALRILENVSDRNTYEYNEAEWKKISGAIDAAVAKVKQRFSDALAGKSTKVQKQGFSI